MTLDPRLVAVTEAASTTAPVVGDDNVLDPAELRAITEERGARGIVLMGEGPEVASITDRRFPVEGGDNLIRIYVPLGDGPFPMHLYFHGGGFFANSPLSFDVWCQHLAAGAGCIVASAAYRLAPEHKFPTAAEDAYAALTWLASRSSELGGDPSRISVGGTSSGGNLAAAVALMARDRGGPALVAQVLEVPVLDLTMSRPSYVENAEGYVLTRRAMAQYIDYYLDRAEDVTNPYASPLLAEDVSGVAPAVIMTAEHDPLRDEGEAYAERLTASGVPSSARRWPGQIHGSQYMLALMPDVATEYREAVVAALRAAYAR